MSHVRPLLLLLPSGCSGVQSALDATGEEAARIETLSWLLFGFCLVVFLGVAAIAIAAIFGSRRLRSVLAREKLVVLGGIWFPIASLTLLLVYSVSLMGKGAAEDDPALRVSVVGERWWWRVTYETPDGRRIASANELRLPVGRAVELELTSADVIHSFWVPKLAGKLDMIPGRTNRLTLLAREPGISRGQCAEYCGGAHAFMSFFVIALEPAAFEAWLANEAGPGRTPEGGTAVEGRTLFVESGCGACHAVRGTTAGTIGPDLTHVGSRHSLAAATLPNSPQAFARWIAEGQHIKPENLMPPFGIFTEPQLASLAAYLAQLE
jgi:cytochrome c oxidase subunit 2